MAVQVCGPVIELRGLARTYPGPPPVPALRPADLVIDEGDYVAVTGPSGSGKSTLLHLLGLLGHVRSAGRVGGARGQARAATDQEQKGRPGAHFSFPPNGRWFTRAGLHQCRPERGLAGIGTPSNDIYNDVAKDPAVSSATQAWIACMARNGYTFHQPGNVFFQELQVIYGKRAGIRPGDPVSAAANQAQIAAAVTDADCSSSTDLGGIYFAVQASYEQQIVNANASALAAAVRQYRAAYTRELDKLPDLLKTASAQPFAPGQPGRSTGPAGQPTSAGG
jgi:energy-coupling factor transporter ATP-binding protein EcfA2